MTGTSPFKFGGGSRGGPYDPSGGGGGGGGGDRWAAIKRMLGGGENPMLWGLPLYTAFGIRVRLHILFFFYIAAELIRASFSGSILFQASMLAMLFVIVLLHEYGHCFACRWVKGEADQIVLWPLGGLAFCNPPHHWKAEFITVIGGPMVNVILLPILGGLVWMTTGQLGAAIFNPFQYETALALATNSLSPWPYWLLVGLWMAHFLNFILLVFNMLIPMYPMDAGRIVQTLLWRKLGYHRSMVISVTVGLVAAVALGVIGIVSDETLLMGIAIFGGITCYMERQRLRFVSTGGLVEDDFAYEPPREPTKADLKREQKEREHFERIEGILDKIKRQGMGSLTKAERKTLERETRRQRGG
jgi:stage IV sporulation protein FB